MEERRNDLRRRALALSVGAALGAAGGAGACELPPGKRLESGQLALSYRTVPEEIAVGEHFVLELAFCPKANFKPSARVRLDAHMPEHRHGMNYRPSVSALGPGRVRSEGWLFHMPGRWEFVFEIGGERLADSVRIE